MDAKKLAGQILKEVGGKENIKEMFHCVTRLRFYSHGRNTGTEKEISGNRHF